MRIDEFYETIDKSHVYLGMISQVYRSHVVLQVENLTLLTFKKIEENIFIPNTINYYVLVDSANGIYFGEVYASKVPNNDSVHEVLRDGYQEKVWGWEKTSL